jgi:CO dehydrogenase/acetyl-CoA synthase alpha subunit
VIDISNKHPGISNTLSRVPLRGDINGTNETGRCQANCPQKFNIDNALGNALECGGSAATLKLTKQSVEVHRTVNLDALF